MLHVHVRNQGSNQGSVIKASVYLQKSSHVLSYVNITNSGFANLRTLACFFTYYIMETPATLRPEHDLYLPALKQLKVLA
jgi:hypothetical protein